MPLKVLEREAVQDSVGGGADNSRKPKILDRMLLSRLENPLQGEDLPS